MTQRTTGINRMSLKRRLKRGVPAYLLLAPYFILFFLFTVLPVLASIVLSFTNFNMLEFPEFVGWKNYLRLLLEDDIFIIAVKNTFIFAVITGPISYMM